MIMARQVGAARALPGFDQCRLAALSGRSLPTIQRMEASEAMVRGDVDSLVKLTDALEAAGIELIASGADSPSVGHGVPPRGVMSRARIDRHAGAEAAVAGRGLA